MNKHLFETLCSWLVCGVAVDFQALGFDVEIITITHPKDSRD